MSPTDALESFAEIAVFSALEKTLHYRIPPGLQDKAQVGSRVLVPLGSREASGLILELQPNPPDLSESVALRPVLEVLDPHPVVPQELLVLCRWIAQYYFYPLGEVLQTALPSGIQTAPLTCVRITLAGRKTLESGRSTISTRILSILAQPNELPSNTIAESLPAVKNLQSHLKNLEKKGLIERSYTWQPPQMRPKIVKTVRLLADPGPEALDKNENLRRLVCLLRQTEGPVPLKRLRPQVGNLNYWVGKLQRGGWLRLEHAEELRESDCAQTLPAATRPELTRDQQNALESITPHIADLSFQPFLVYGVTGSGKTEVYLRLVEKALQHHRGAIVLVPEIALSTQVEAVFRQRFGAQLAIAHSGLAPGARYDQWREVLAGNRKIVLGVRSAIFMPVPDLGLIIVDEEHDASYKQEDRLRYHARDVALMRASMLKIPIVMGSATPSLQTVHHVLSNRYKSVRLPRRIHDRPLPTLQIVDMRRESSRSKILSRALQKALMETVDGGQQALIFLNRRGFATFLLCHLCGHVLHCPHCSISLTYHQKHDLLLCHYCGWQASVPEHCPECHQPALVPQGFGTERVEQEVRTIAPGISLVRIDRDTVLHSRDVVTHLNAMRQARASVLIGTQMIAKGHDFPNITLVGIINADTALQIADFHAGENTVQLLMQVAGRAGRGERPGRVILQTYNPSHYTIESVVQMDYLSFSQRELESRQRLLYPPYTRLLRLLLAAPGEDLTQRAARELGVLCRNVAQEIRSRGQHVAILGPAPAPLSKISRRYRWHIFVKAWTNQVLQTFTQLVLERKHGFSSLRRVHLAIDRDPMTSL